MNVILFGGPEGERTPAADDDASSPLIDFLQGKSVTMTPELATALLEEFSAQERFRLKLRASMTDLVKAMLGEANALQGRLQVPYRESEQYDAGYTAGRYAQATEGAQLAQNTLNEALEMLAV